jgi:hypothetical protein
MFDFPLPLSPVIALNSLSKAIGYYDEFEITPNDCPD